jgi:hypothetical protein
MCYLRNMVNGKIVISVQYIYLFTLCVVRFWVFIFIFFLAGV